MERVLTGELLPERDIITLNLPVRIITPTASLPGELPALSGELPPLSGELDPVAMLLADKRSAATRRAYRADLVHFFGGEPAPGDVAAFAALPREQVAVRLADYKARLIGAGLAEATVNRRLSAVRSLLSLCYRIGFAQTDGRGLVEGEKSRSYRDTRGISLPQLRRLLDAPERDGVTGLRDRAMLRLLCENALRRAEVCALDVADFNRAERRIMVVGKGRGTEREPITISAAAAAAITAYLERAGHRDGALFRNRDHRTGGARLTAKGLYDLVRAYGKRIGEENLAPHKLRHSAITAALEMTGGDVRKVQKLSRHKRIETLLIYDDNRADLAGELTGMLSGALGG